MTLFWLILLSTRTHLWAAEISLSADTVISTEGYFVLSWTADPASEETVELQQSTSESFTNPRTFELPAAGSITITGLENGQYFFRARSTNLPFSNTVKVEVAHHSLQRAFMFFTVGLFLLLTLLVTIIYGQRNSGAIPDER